MKMTFELKLLVTVDGDNVTVEVADQNETRPASTTEWKGMLNNTIDVNDNTYTTRNTSVAWHGSEEMWYTTYKE
jgi:hypothetical protein